MQGSTGAWGGILNATINAIDAALKTISDLANAALPKAGGAMSGRLDVQVATSARRDVTPAGGAVTLDLAQAQYFTLTLSGPTIVNITNVPDGQVVTAVMLRITNGGAGLILPGGTQWSNGEMPALTANGVDVVGLITDDNGTTWTAVLIAQDVHT